MERSTESSSTNGLSRQGGSASMASGMGSKMTGEQLRTSATEATDKILSSASKAAEALGEQSRKLKDGQIRLSESCRTHMREKPLSSLGIAVAAGFLLALIFKRK